MANAHGRAQAVEQALAPVRQFQGDFVAVRAEFQLPPALLLAVAVQVQAQPAGRWQLLDAAHMGVTEDSLLGRRLRRRTGAVPATQTPQEA